MISIEPFTDGRYKSIPIICGPTASGKSSLAMALCLEIHGELCSMDSMQIYRHMDIGTAKPTKEEQKQVPHHLIDLIEPAENFSAAMYKDAALGCIDNCLKRGRLPVFCGGTGQYAGALVQGISYMPLTIDPAVAQAVLSEANEYGYEALHHEIEKVDPEAASKIHPNNKKRVLRAMEIYRQTGKTMTYFNGLSIREGPQYPFSLFALDLDRETLYKKMDSRVDQMLESGLLEEVRILKQLGLTSSHTSMQAIGYKELFGFLEGLESYEEAVLKIKQKTRNYGKRQLTWFRNMGGVIWIKPGNISAVKQVIQP